MKRVDSETSAAWRLIREVGGVYVVVSVLIVLATQLRSSPLDDYVSLLVAALFLFPALRLAQRESGGLDRYGIALGGVLSPDVPLFQALARGWRSAVRELLVALGVALVVFPPFALAFRFWNAPTRPFEWTWPDEPLSFIAGHLIVIALPEEAFFRGYVQTRLTDAGSLHDAVFWKPRRVLLATFSPGALVAQAALFALVHFAVDQHPARLAVFFPGLLFGWLRAWRGGIGAAIVFHALCNLYQAILVQGWL